MEEVQLSSCVSPLLLFRVLHYNSINLPSHRRRPPAVIAHKFLLSSSSLCLHFPRRRGISVNGVDFGFVGVCQGGNERKETRLLSEVEAREHYYYYYSFTPSSRPNQLDELVSLVSPTTANPHQQIQARKPLSTKRRNCRSTGIAQCRSKTRFASPQSVEADSFLQ